MRALLLVVLGSALGGAARFLIAGWVGARMGGAFPWGTVLVNVSGSALIGALAAREEMLSPEARQFLMAGVLGGFTTFSSFSLQTLRLAQDGDWARAAGNVLGTAAAVSSTSTAPEPPV
ncbi:MAG: fluoride efflux transporter FluC, partial [Verrucomicrobiota bacterium]